MDRLINDSKELISESRMVTIGKLYQRFTRAGRDIAIQNDKNIKFLTSCMAFYGKSGFGYSESKYPAHRFAKAM